MNTPVYRGGQGIVVGGSTLSRLSRGHVDLPTPGFKPSDWRWRTSLAQSVRSDIEQHTAILERLNFDEKVLAPEYYVKVVVEPANASAGSSRQHYGELAAENYASIEGQLDELEALATEPDAPVERGAIESAKHVVRELRRLHFAPPEMTWHGGDSVVMLWAFDSTTWAVTVTDGQVGYVIRRDRKRLKLRDSIDINDFQLLSIG